MYKAHQDNSTHKSGNAPTGWDAAIAEARRQIEAAQDKIKRLGYSIQTFEEMRAKGEPFPSEEREQTEAKA